MGTIKNTICKIGVFVFIVLFSSGCSDLEDKNEFLQQQNAELISVNKKLINELKNKKDKISILQNELNTSKSKLSINENALLAKTEATIALKYEKEKNSASKKELMSKYEGEFRDSITKEVKKEIWKNVAIYLVLFIIIVILISVFIVYRERKNINAIIESEKSKYENLLTKHISKIEKLEEQIKFISSQKIKNIEII